MCAVALEHTGQIQGSYAFSHRTLVGQGIMSDVTFPSPPLFTASSQVALVGVGTPVTSFLGSFVSRETTWVLGATGLGGFLLRETPLCNITRLVTIAVVCYDAASAENVRLYVNSILSDGAKLTAAKLERSNNALPDAV